MIHINFKLIYWSLFQLQTGTSSSWKSLHSDLVFNCQPSGTTVLLSSNSLSKGFIFSFSSMSIHLISLQVYVKEQALGKTRSHSMPLGNRQGRKLGADYQAERQPNLLSLPFPHRHHKTLTPWPRPSHARHLTGANLGCRNRTGNGVTRHEQELTRGGGGVRTKYYKLNFFHKSAHYS